MSAGTTPSQTVGPFFEIGLSWLYDADVAGALSGERVTIEGQLLDGDGAPVPDAVLEIWQADAEGRYAHPEDPRCAEVASGFRGFGRVATQLDGGFRFRTLKPGSVQGQAPHLNVSIFTRGLLKAVATRMYFPDEPRNTEDRVLSLVPSQRRATLLARRAGSDLLRWDVHLQGAAETVFFEL